MKDDLLYKWNRRADGTERLRVYVPESMRWSIISAFHDHLGHPGESTTHKLISERLYWPGMDKAILDYVNECHECTLAKPRRQGASFRGPQYGQFPFDLMYVDILDMAPTHDFEKGVAGHDKLIVFVDALTRWVEAVPCNGDPTSEQLLDAFMTHVVSRHGCPRVLRSDYGSNICSQL